MPRPADKLCTFSGTAAGDAANKLGATMRGETSAESTLALLESCLCNAVLPPHEADAIHPLAGLLPASMSPEQRMCVRHCVPCRRLRARLTLADTPMFRVGAAAFFGAARARAVGSAPAPVATFSLPALLADGTFAAAGAAGAGAVVVPQASPSGTPARPSRGGAASASAGAASASGAGAGAGAGSGAGSKAPLASPPPTAGKGKSKVSRGGGVSSADAAAAESAAADAAASADAAGSASAGGASSARKRGRKASAGPSSGRA